MAHILIVDDRPMNREFLVTLLGYFGHTLAEAADGVEALARVTERQPDLVITDLLMPNMDGEEFTRRLRADPATKAMPVIIYTAAYRAREARAIADRLGVQTVLAKPADPQVIVAAVAKELGAAAPEASAPADLPRAPGGPTAALDMGALKHFGSVHNLNLRMVNLLENAAQVAAEQSKSLIPVRGMAEALEQVHLLGARLAGLVELGLDLAGTRNPQEMIELFCRAVQDIVSVKYAGVAVMDRKGMKLSHFVARGLPRDQAERVAREIADCPAAKRVLSGGDSGRLVIGAKPSDVTGLPASHPPVRNFVACPIGAHGTTFGWMYVADRLAEGVFSTDDERIVLALGAQFAIAWEGLALYSDLERQVAERTKQLEQSNRELEAFSLSVSHDLRAPLRAIDGFNRMVLEEHSGGLPAEGQRLLGMVRGQTQKMAKLIDDLLELARVGRRELGFHPVKLDDFVRNCLRELKSETEGRKVELVIGELPTWNADPILLKQLFLNLLSNALKYTRKREAARIEIGAEPRDGEQVVYVRDNGVGFDMAEATKLFTVFQRLHAEEEYPGTGIGLAIVRRVAERHGGSVWAQAEPDRGAVFYVALPAAPEA